MSKGRQRQEGVDRGTDLHYVATWATIRSLAQAPEWGDSQKNEDRRGQVDAIAGRGRDWEGVQCGQRDGAGWKDSSDTLPTRCGIWGWEEDREVASWCLAWEQGMCVSTERGTQLRGLAGTGSFGEPMGQTGQHPGHQGVAL